MLNAIAKYFRGFWLLTAAACFFIQAGCGGPDSRKNEITDHGNFFAISSDGNRIVFNTTKGGLFLCDLANFHITDITQKGIFANTPRFSPDGKTIVFSGATRDGGLARNIYRLSLDDGRATALSTGAVFDIYPSFSPDGRKIMFSRGEDLTFPEKGDPHWQRWNIFLMNSDGSELTNSSTSNYRFCSGKFMPDGKNIVFSAILPYTKEQYGSSIYVATNRSLLRMPADGSGKPELVLGPGLNLGTGVTKSFEYAQFVDPSPLPDGSAIAVLGASKLGANKILLLDPTSFSIRPIGFEIDKLFIENIEISPDGKKIFFLNRRDTGGVYGVELYSIGIDGKNPLKIADTGLFKNPQTWEWAT